MKHKKLFIFDLDNTIYFNQYDDYYKEFHINIHHLIKKLYEQGKIIAIVTYNLDPESCLEFLNIKEYVSYIYKPINSLQEYDLTLYDIRSETTYLDKIYYHLYKSFFINNLKTKLTHISNDEMIFFDDSIYNIKDVEKNCNIECVPVDSKTGLDFDLILKKI